MQYMPTLSENRVRLYRVLLGSGYRVACMVPDARMLTRRITVRESNPRDNVLVRTVTYSKTD